MKRLSIIRCWARTVITTMCEVADGTASDAFDVDMVLHCLKTNFPYLVDSLGGLSQRRCDIIGIVNMTVKYSSKVSDVYTDEIFGKEWAEFVHSYKEN